MSISSVGGLFGYVDPATVAGPGRASQPATDASDTSAAFGATSDRNAPAASSQSPFPTVASTGTQTGGSRQFAPATASALIRVQEGASASTT